MKYVFLTGFLALSLKGMNPDDRPLPAWHSGGKLQKILEADKARLLEQQHARTGVFSADLTSDSVDLTERGDIDHLLRTDVLKDESAESEAQEVEMLKERMSVLRGQLETQREEDRERFAALTRLAAAPARPASSAESVAEGREISPEEKIRAEREAAEQLLRLLGSFAE